MFKLTSLRKILSGAHKKRISSVLGGKCNTPPTFITFSKVILLKKGWIVGGVRGDSSRKSIRFTKLLKSVKYLIFFKRIFKMVLYKPVFKRKSVVNSMVKLLSFNEVTK